MIELGFFENIIKDPKSKKNFAVKLLSCVLGALILAGLVPTVLANGYPPVLLLIAASVIAALLYFVFIFFSIEYECAVSETCVSLAKIYGKRRRREIFSAERDEILLIARFNESNLKKAEDYRPRERFDIYSKKEQNNLWIVVFEIEKNQNAIFIFHAPAGIEKIFRKLKPSGFIA